MHLVLSCEHASPRVPDGLNLGLPPKVLESHVSWDPGALPIAEGLAARFSAPVIAGAYSRLVVDLNRWPDAAEAVPEVAFGVPVPGNRGLSPEARADRLAHHRAHWDAVYGALEAAAGPVLHLSVHTFDPGFGEADRPWDFGILCDPDHAFEGPVARRLLDELRAPAPWLAEPPEHRAEINVPYDGRSPFLVTNMRGRFASGRYAGILLEVNQRHHSRWGAVTDHVARAVRTLVGTKGLQG